MILDIYDCFLNHFSYSCQSIKIKKFLGRPCIFIKKTGDRFYSRFYPLEQIVKFSVDGRVLKND